MPEKQALYGEFSQPNRIIDWAKSHGLITPPRHVCSLQADHLHQRGRNLRATTMTEAEQKKLQPKNPTRVEKERRNALDRARRKRVAEALGRECVVVASARS
jgi:hypothetical protein